MWGHRDKCFVNKEEFTDDQWTAMEPFCHIETGDQENEPFTVWRPEEWARSEKRRVLEKQRSAERVTEWNEDKEFTARIYAVVKEKMGLDAKLAYDIVMQVKKGNAGIAVLLELSKADIERIKR